MKNLTIIAVLTAAAAGLSGCAEEAGRHALLSDYGEATAANLRAQTAYGGDAVLSDLSQAFQASTDEVVTFAFDRATLDATARQALDGQARWLRENPHVRMTIVGHTDLVGPESYNYGLGLRRARSALDYLVAQGVDRSRLDAIESRGETDPVIPTESRERRNRRAVTHVAGFAAGYVGTGLDGEYAQRIYNIYQAGQVEVSDADAEIN